MLVRAKEPALARHRGATTSTVASVGGPRTAMTLLSRQTSWRTRVGRSATALCAPVLVLASCTGADRASAPATATTQQPAPTTTTIEATTTTRYPPVPRPPGSAGLVWASCFETRRLNLALAQWHMTTEIFNSDDEARLIYVMLADAAERAATAAENDAAWTEFAAATAQWRDSVLDPASGGGPTEALKTIAVTCAQFGLDRGVPGDIPTTPDTPEYGRASACRRIFFHVPDRVGFADGEPFTVEDCLGASERALQATGRRDAYQETIEAFFALTPGYLCYGEQCWDEADFPAH